MPTDNNLAERIAAMRAAAEKAQGASDITAPDADYFAAINNFQLECGPAAVLALLALVEQQEREVAGLRRLNKLPLESH